MNKNWSAFIERCTEDSIVEDGPGVVVETKSWYAQWHAKHMQDPEFAAAIEELEPEYQRARERYSR